MSYGMTPYDFVQQVFYMQEKTLLDFHPDDDKYKEVLVEANLVLQELQNSEDWTWCRERIVLGSTDDLGHGGGRIPEYLLPDKVYKPSTLHDDTVRLYARHRCRHGRGCSCCGDCIDEWDYIPVPYISIGSVAKTHVAAFDSIGRVNVPDRSLGAVVIGGVLTFNRPLLAREKGRMAVADFQIRLPQLHVCNDSCPRDENGKCKLIEDRVFQMIPDPNYMVVRTAALHAEGSPPAQGMIAGLTDQAQKLLSAMRANDTSATEPDYIDWAEFGYVPVL